MPESKRLEMDEEAPSKGRFLQRKCLNYSMYEWLMLLSSLFIPLIIGILSIVLPLQQQNLSDRQNENSKIIALNNRLQDMDLLRDQQRQMVLNSYEHDLSELLLKYESLHHGGNDTSADEDEHEREDDEDDERVSLVIRTKTLHAIRQLDPGRKILLIQLLIDSGVQHRINISHADLSSLIFPPGSTFNQLQLNYVVARNISLKRVGLFQSNFSYSILDNSSFEQSNCSFADFTYASLQQTDWTNTDLTQAMFNYSNLLGARLTPQQLAVVNSLQGAILPNGSIAVVWRSHFP